MPSTHQLEHSIVETLDRCFETLNRVAGEEGNWDPRKRQLARGTLSYLERCRSSENGQLPVSVALLGLASVARVLPGRLKHPVDGPTLARAVRLAGPTLETHAKELMALGARNPFPPTSPARATSSPAPSPAPSPSASPTACPVPSPSASPTACPAPHVAGRAEDLARMLPPPRGADAGEGAEAGEGPDRFVAVEVDPSLTSERRQAYRGILGGGGWRTLVEARVPEFARPEDMPRLVSWLRSVGSLGSGHLARIEGVIAHQGRLMVVHEPLEGQTLEHVLQRGVLGEPAVRHYMVEILKSLATLHRSGHVFRELRPDRIVILPDGTVKLFDIPFPRDLERGPDRETLNSGGLVGDIRYFAPETCLDVQPVEPTVDIYSLGMIVAEMLLGTPNLRLLTGEDVRIWANWHIDPTRRAVRLDTLDPALSPELARLVERMLEKSHALRVRDAIGLLQDLAGMRPVELMARAIGASGDRAGGLGAGPGGGANQEVGGANQEGVGSSAARTGPRRVRLKTWTTRIGVGVVFSALSMGMGWALVRDIDQAAAPVERSSRPVVRQTFEKVLGQMRRGDFEAAEVTLSRLDAGRLPGPDAETWRDLEHRISEARSHTARYTLALEDARVREESGDLAEAVDLYHEAILAWQARCRTLQQENLEAPPEIRRRLEELEPRQLLEGSRKALDRGDVREARRMIEVCLSTYPRSPLIPRAQKLARAIREVPELKAQYRDAFERGRSRTAAGQYGRAIDSLYRARAIHETVQKVLGRSTPVPPDLEATLDQAYERLWVIDSPRAGQDFVAEELVVELSLPSHHFTQARVGTETSPVLGDRVITRFPGAEEGLRTLEVQVTTSTGRIYTRPLKFRFRRPPERLPMVTVQAIAGSGTNLIVEIAYGGTSHRVHPGWTSPDGAFEVIAVDMDGIRIRTRKGTEVPVRL